MNPNEDILDALLGVAKAIGYGEIPPRQSNECFTSGAFDLVVFQGNDAGKNFDLLSALCDRYGAIKQDGKFLKGYCFVLDRLAYATGTTEPPRGMRRILEENPEATRNLQIWYRAKGIAPEE